MPIEILMPALSPTMTEGNLAKWNVKEGDKVKSGQVIAEIETDKATMEVEAVDEGVVGKILIPAGTEGVKVNAAIALLLEEGEDKKALEKFEESRIRGFEEPKKEQSQKVEVGSVMPAVLQTASNLRTFASPLAKRIAAQEGIDIAQVPGSGPHGRVVRSDVENFKAGGGSARGVVRRNPAEVTKIPNNNMRKVIARRLTESKQTVPHFYLSVECELDKLLDLRKDFNEEAEIVAGKGGKPAYKLSVNDFIIKAVALGLKKIPAANASWTDEAILQYNNIDVSVAVATPGGLITPIIRNADQKTLPQISAEMKELAGRARENKLKPEEFQGGGFSLSNLGMYGVKNFSAIINPPQGCILAVGAGEERAVVRGGRVVIRNVMDVTLSVDHRVVDGAIGAEFLAAFKRYVEKPGLMVG